MKLREIAIKDAIKKGYRCTKDGKIIGAKGYELKLKMNHTGYYSFTIKGSDRPNKNYTILVHQFVAYKKFGNKSFNDGIFVRHLDGNGKNNSEDNIAIGTPHDNQMDMSPEARHLRSMSNKRPKKWDTVVEEVRIDRANGFTYKDIYNKYGIIKSSLSYLLNSAYY